jgi:hypothetical protein
MTDTVQVPREALENLLDHYLHCYGGIHDQLALDVRAMIAAAPQATDPREEIGCCDGCGSTKSLAQIHAESPRALSCCPERKMLTAKQWSERAEAAESRIATLTAERDESIRGHDSCKTTCDRLRDMLAAAGTERDALREALMEVRTAAGVLYRTQVYQNRKREEGVSVDFVIALNYLIAVAGYREPLRHEYEPDQMAKINRARALTTQPSKTETPLCAAPKK